MTLSRLFLLAMTGLSLIVAIVSWRFLVLDLALAFPDMVMHVTERRGFFLAHIAASPLALGIGALQFFPAIRRRKSLHRFLGRLYGLAILLGGIGGLGIALHANGGLPARLGFALLALAWIGVTAGALRHALRGDFARHRRWMIRSFALTFAGVSLRLQLAIGMAAAYDYATLVPVLAWACWLPNLAIAEWLIRGRR